MDSLALPEGYMTCPQCRGVGHVLDPDYVGREPLIITFRGVGICPVTLKPPYTELMCMREGHHDGEPHEGPALSPCLTCWGLDSHVDGCPEIQDDHESKYSPITLAFDDDGTFWVKQ